MKVIAEIPVFGQSGFEVISRGIALSLQKLGVDVRIVEKTDWNAHKCQIDSEDFARLDHMARAPLHSTDFYYIMQQYPKGNPNALQRALKTFCYTLFETDRCPVPWIAPLNSMTETWTFSEFNKKTFSHSGVHNVQSIPFGIDSNLFNPSATPFEFGKKDEFVFLTNGDFTERKNFEGLIEAYVKEFTCKDKVVLVIKSHYAGFSKKFQQSCIGRFREIVQRFNPIDPPRILFLGDKLPVNDMPRFYTAGDCFILTSRGEGIGLPYAEALACGVPVIATNWGGQLEFLNSTNSLLVNYEVRQIDDMEYIRKCLWALNHKWAFPAVGDIREKMRYAYEFRALMKQKGIKGRADMEKMTWQNAGLKIINRMISAKEKV